MQWEKAHIDFVRELHATEKFASIVKKFNSKFRTDVTQKALERAWESNKNKRWPAAITRESLTKNVTRRMDKGVMFVTAATPYAAPGKGCLNAVQAFCKAHSAELLVLPMREHAKPLQKQRFHYHPSIEPLLCNTHIEVNKHLTIADLKLNPQMTYPLTGLWRICGKERTRSFLIAHTKQALQLVPAKLEGLPRMLHTTGCITVPTYNMDERMGYIAHSDHVMGGVIVYVDGDIFYPVQVQFDTKGGFYDPLGTYYGGDGVIDAGYRPAATKWGDYHCGSTDGAAATHAKAIAKYTQPEELYLEDFVDGYSVNHHAINDVIEQAQLAAGQHNDLAMEGVIASAALSVIKHGLPDTQLIVTSSNHNDFVNRYIRSGRYVKDAVNFVIAHKLALAMVEKGADPAQVLVDPQQTLAKWLQPNEDRFVAGVQMAVHGHAGMNGSKGSPKAMEYAFGNVMTGHTHSPSITHGGVVVGTLSRLRLGYNNGPSNWLHAIGHVWPNGQKMLIFIINGKSCYSTMGVL